MALVSYPELVKDITEKLLVFKTKRLANKAMVVGVEGLCGSGKSTLTRDIVDVIGERAVLIEGDLFHRGRGVVHSLYQDIIQALDNGYLAKCDFHHLLTWKTEELKQQILQIIKEFNNGPDKIVELKLRDVLDNKTNGTEHKAFFTISKNSIILLPLTFMRHFSEIDFLIHLDVSLTTSINRKIERTEREHVNRDIDLTKNIINRLEFPTMEAMKKKNKRQPDIIIDTNNFFRINVEYRTISNS